MTKSELKQLIRESLNELMKPTDDALNFANEIADKARARVRKKGASDLGLIEAIRDMIAHKLTKENWHKYDQEKALQAVTATGDPRLTMKEMTTSAAAGGQEGGTIRVPTWVSKKKFGSPAAVKGSKSLGYKVVKDISDMVNKSLNKKQN